MGAAWSAAADGRSGFVRALIDAGVRVSPGREGWEHAAGGLAARAGVVALEDEAGRSVLLGTTADARAFVTARCAVSIAGKRADLGAVSARAVVVPVASGFEADLVYMAMARERTPAAYRKLMARWGVWVARLDATDEFPEATAMQLEDAAGQRAESLIGPISEQGAARLIEAVVDAFDLCRYPHILKQVPRGVACAYKEMGRCPAPCDGTEAMESYRSRVRGAVESVGRRAPEREEGLTARMKAAAGASRFEEAATLKKQLERVQALDAPGLRGVTTMDRFRHVVVAPGVGRGTVRVYGWVGGRLVRVIDLRAKETEGVVEFTRETAAEQVDVPATPEEIDGVSVLARWLAKPASKRRVRVVRLGGPDDVGEVLAAVRSVARVGDKQPEDEVEEVEIQETGGAAGVP